MIRRIIRRLMRGRKSTERPTRTPEFVPEPIDEESDAEEVMLEVERSDLEAWQADGIPFEILDIREPYEYRQGVLRPSWLIPMNDVPEQLQRLDASQRWVVVCAAGMRSFSVAHYMRDNGIADAWSMVGGLGTWADQGYGHAPNESKFGLGDWVRWRENDSQVKGRVQWIDDSEKDRLVSILPENGTSIALVQKRESELSRP